MKKCEHFKDLILTDYIDGELSKDASSLLESHLLDCSDCRAFFKEVKTNVSLPLQRSMQQTPPAELWEKIRQRIEHQQQISDPVADFIDKLNSLLVFPRMIPVFASLILMFLVGSFTFNTIQIRQAQEREQGEYLVSLLSPASTASSTESNDLGTPIEHYFL